MLGVVLLIGCHQNRQVSDSKEIFLSMERTPCLGTCPHYKFTIFDNKEVLYEGRNFIEPKDTLTFILNDSVFSLIQQKVNVLKIFELADTYHNPPMLDVPGVILYYKKGEKTKTIQDITGAPEQLKAFEKFLDRTLFGEMKE